MELKRGRGGGCLDNGRKAMPLHDSQRASRATPWGNFVVSFCHCTCYGRSGSITTTSSINAMREEFKGLMRARGNRLGVG